MALPTPSCGWIAALVLSAATLDPPPAPFHAAGKQRSADGWALLELDGLTLRLRELSGQERASFLLRSARLEADPFARLARAGEPLLVTFLLEAVNGGRETVTVSPASFTARHSSEKRPPRGFTALYHSLVAAADEEQAQRLGGLLDESSFALAPGETAARILAYDRIPPRWQRLKVEVRGIEIGRREGRGELLFER